MHIDLVDLRLFIQIAEATSLSKGARQSFISPAAASVRIKSMESQLKAHLFYRGNRGVELTAAGERLLKHARLVMRQMGYLESEFTEFGTDGSGHIRIFANTTAVTEFMPDILAGFLATNPGVTVDLQERLTKDIVRGVVEGATDLGIVAGPVPTRDLQAIHFSTDKLVLVVPLDHELGGRATIKLEDALDYPHVGLQVGSTLQQFMVEQAGRLGKQLRLRVQVSSFEAICMMVEAGVGIGVLPESAAARHSVTKRLLSITLDEPWAKRERSILVREIEALPACIRALINLMTGHSG
ncbi:LysR family transcriptional regulator [Pseudomonas tolaasii]|uniref:LysR family transcriptional regulator n=1 Tax=Pseudomonas tolaasii TaxID=29442 RepID=UPI001C5F6446|nr:LysR family transcriptional regulator [Pseudomonas tolaasii]MBW4793256.1 LysR family transcriptional regulator [Pseudomonas tolaasii]